MTKEEYEDFVLRYKGCGACFPMYHTLSRFEKKWFTAIQKDVAELEKELKFEKSVNGEFTAIEKLRELEVENTNLKDVIEGYKKIVKWCDKCDKLAELEKENAELRAFKEKCKFNVNDIFKEIETENQLTEAKELIKDIIRVTWGEGWNYSLDWKVKAEQFLSEVEK